MANPAKKTLSRNLSQMKFMRRVSQPIDKGEVEGSGTLIEKWTAPTLPEPIEGNKRVKVIECSFAECENLNTFGRFSYNKFNKEVERLSQQYSKQDEGSEGSDEDGTIPAKEVAKRYKEMPRRFLGKHQRSTNGAEGERDVIQRDQDGFMKPV